MRGRRITAIALVAMFFGILLIPPATAAPETHKFTLDRASWKVIPLEGFEKDENVLIELVSSSRPVNIMIMRDEDVDRDEDKDGLPSWYENSDSTEMYGDYKQTSGSWNWNIKDNKGWSVVVENQDLYIGNVSVELTIDKEEFIDLTFLWMILGAIIFGLVVLAVGTIIFIVKFYLPRKEK